MRVEYDAQADAIYIRLRAAQAVDTDVIREGVVADYAADGEIVGIELLSASKR